MSEVCSGEQTFAQLRTGFIFRYLIYPLREAGATMPGYEGYSHRKCSATPLYCSVFKQWHGRQCLAFFFFYVCADVDIYLVSYIVRYSARHLAKYPVALSSVQRKQLKPQASTRNNNNKRKKETKTQLTDRGI